MKYCASHKYLPMRSAGDIVRFKRVRRDNHLPPNKLPYKTLEHEVNSADIHENNNNNKNPPSPPGCKKKK